jgi:copper chaperone CopZ
MGCPDAVRAELLKVTGVLAVTYFPDQDVFVVNFDPVLVNLDTIFATVFTTGKMMGHEYLPELQAPSPEAGGGS